MRKLSFLLAVISVLCIKSYSQNSLNDLNVFFKHDFENNTLGYYLKEEWKRDFNYPEWNCRQSETEIVRSTTDPVNPTKTLKLNFPANSLGSNEGGAYWWTKIEEQEEVYFSYDLYFMPGFKYQIGGKLPSMQGGELSAAGGSTGYDGFTGGMMFKEDGRIVSYIYYPDAKEPKYGESFTWGLNGFAADAYAPSSIVVEYASGDVIYCKPGEWHNITYRMVLNTVKPAGGGNFDGILEAYFDGKLVLQISHFLYRHTTELKIDNLRIISFFGGGTDNWRNPIEEWLKVDNLLLYTYKDNIDVPRGNKLSSRTRTLNYWRNFDNHVENPVTPPDPVPTVNNPPSIATQNFIVNESGFSNNFIGKVISSDPDAGQVLTYKIVSGNEAGLFTLNSQTGELKTTSNKVFGPGTSSFELKVSVTDNAQEPKSATATIMVNLIGNSKVVYINPMNGADKLANGSIDHPYASWQQITWKDGFTYLQKRGTSILTDKLMIGANNITLGAYGQGELPLIESETSTYLISGFEKSNIKIQNLNLRAEYAVSCIYFLGSGSDSIVIDGCRINGSANAIKIVDGKSLVLKYNIISSEHEGIFTSAVSNKILYNIFKDCPTAVNVMGNSASASLYNNVFFNNKVSLSVSYAELTLYNNIFYMLTNGQTALNFGTGHLTSDHNIYYPEQDGFITIAKVAFDNLKQLQQEMKIDINSFNSDPQFVDMYNENFALVETSPAINTGINLSQGLDLEGSKVPVSGVADIGAIEFNGTISPQEKDEQSRLTLYPNPSSGYVNILADIEQNQTADIDNIGFSELKVLDISGKTIFTKQIENQTGSTIQDNIDLTGVSNGLYFVVLQMADKAIKGKIVISR